MENGFLFRMAFKSRIGKSSVLVVQNIKVSANDLRNAENKMLETKVLVPYVRTQDKKVVVTTRSMKTLLKNKISDLEQKRVFVSPRFMSA